MTRNHIWSNIKDKNPNVRRVNKTLNLVEYLIINSTEELVNEFKEEIFYINMLKEYKSNENFPDITQLGSIFYFFLFEWLLISQRKI